jgi:quercetin dioxygenase-like cupin family protein
VRVSTPIVRIDQAEPMLGADLLALRYIGNAEMRRVNEALGTMDVLLNAVFFEPGSRTKPHSHSYDQLVYYVTGPGVVHVAGGQEQRIEAGECALLPAGIAHMHGATEDSPATHLSIMRAVDMDFDCPIPPDWERWRT